MSDWKEHEDKDRSQEVVIQDRRHTRDIEDLGADESEPVAPVPEAVPPVPPAEIPAPEPEPAGSGEVVEFRPSARRPEPADDAPADLPPPQSAEEAQLRMLFEMGITGYLFGQLQLLLTFAVIYLGHEPNPATGLVSPDLDKARLAIDLLDFIVIRTQGGLPPEERANLTKIITELKLQFAQAMQRRAPEPPEAGNGH